MTELSAAAERLHVIEDAMGDFIMRWAVDQIISDVAEGGKFHGDIIRAQEKFLSNDQSFSHYQPRMDD